MNWGSRIGRLQCDWDGAKDRSRSVDNSYRYLSLFKDRENTVRGVTGSNNVPSATLANTATTRFARLLQGAFARQAIDAARLLSPGILTRDEVPRFDHWPEILAETVKPLVLQLTQQGVIDSRRRLARFQGGRTSEAMFRLPARITLRNDTLFGKRLKQLGVSFDLFDPLVLRAVDKATLEFCEETNATAVGELKEAVAKLRKLLKSGLEEGRAVAELARQVRRIFADPNRAYRIAITETARALNGGALLNAKESSLRLKKEWLSSGGCQDCRDLDGVQKELDEPFVIRGSGPYSRVLYPPLHPYCVCDWTEVLA